MHLDAVEKALDDNNRFAVGRSAVEIKEHERLAESWREPILRLGLVDRSTGIGDQKPLLIVNRYDDAAGHGSLSAVITDSEMTGGFRIHTALGEIRVRAIDEAERKRQRLVAVDRRGVVRVLYFALVDGRGMHRRHNEAVLELQRRLTDRAVLHRRDEVQYVASDLPTSRRNARAGMAGPGVLLSVHNEAVATVLGGVRW